MQQKAELYTNQNHQLLCSIQDINTQKKQSIIQNPNRTKNAKLKNAKIDIKTPANPDSDWENTTVPKPYQKTKTGTV